jgi:hypothetical protein
MQQLICFDNFLETERSRRPVAYFLHPIRMDAIIVALRKYKILVKIVTFSVLLKSSDRAQPQSKYEISQHQK